MAHLANFKRRLIILAVLCLFAHVQKTEGRPSSDSYDDDDSFDDRNKRIIGLGTALGSRASNNLVDDSDDYRENRRSPPYPPFLNPSGSKTTYPPFPGDDDDYDRYVTTGRPFREPNTEPPYLNTPPSTSEEYIYDGGSSSSNNELGRSNENKPFHHKIVPWIRRQWGHTKDFFGRLG